jgi:hypothetical protein
MKCGGAAYELRQAEESGCKECEGQQRGARQAEEFRADAEAAVYLDSRTCQARQTDIRTLAAAAVGLMARVAFVVSSSTWFNGTNWCERQDTRKAA